MILFLCFVISLLINYLLAVSFVFPVLYIVLFSFHLLAFVWEPLETRWHISRDLSWDFLKLILSLTPCEMFANLHISAFDEITFKILVRFNELWVKYVATRIFIHASFCWQQHQFLVVFDQQVPQHYRQFLWLLFCVLSNAVCSPLVLMLPCVCVCVCHLNTYGSVNNRGCPHKLLSPSSDGSGVGRLNW